MLVQAAISGVDGAIGSTYNVNGKRAREIFENAQQGNIDKAYELQPPEIAAWTNISSKPERINLSGKFLRILSSKKKSGAVYLTPITLSFENNSSNWSIEISTPVNPGIA